MSDTRRREEINDAEIVHQPRCVPQGTLVVKAHDKPVCLIGIL